MLNKLRCQLQIFSHSDYLIDGVDTKIPYILNHKQCRSRSVGFFRSQLIWIYTVCKGRANPGSAGQRLTLSVLNWNEPLHVKMCLQDKYRQQRSRPSCASAIIKCYSLNWTITFILMIDFAVHAFQFHFQTFFRFVDDCLLLLAFRSFLLWTFHILISA